ncbi:MAG: DUF4157 domain-containing protein [Roseivirga sp.]|nr:DUF4157 domain-containing protein [Roseivirga sp.]
MYQSDYHNKSKSQPVSINRATTLSGSQRKVQAKLVIGRPNDRYEQEANRMADQLTKTPQSRTTPVQRKCAACEKEEIQRQPINDEAIQTEAAPGGPIGPTAQVENTIQQTRGQGSRLDNQTKSHMEHHFGADFSSVNIHTGNTAVQLNQELNANAFTVGNDVYFNEGKYRPHTAQGQHLLAHELTHTLQQGASHPGINQSLSENTIAGDWKIGPRRGANPLKPGGKTDDEIVAEAFAELCPLTSLVGSTIKVDTTTPVPASNQKGCGCLRTVETHMPGAKSHTPIINLIPDIWSNHQGRNDPIVINIRHPDAPFKSGHWTGQPHSATEERQSRPLWLTIGHEICGHAKTNVETRGADRASRSSPSGHNKAIDAENELSTEKGVPASKLRGLDKNPLFLSMPANPHRGESFLQERVSGYTQFNQTDLNIRANQAVFDSLVETLKNFKRANRIDLHIQVEGVATITESPNTATERAIKLRTHIESLVTGNGLSMTINGRLPRFGKNLESKVPDINPMNAFHGTTDGYCLIYLYHKPWSEG